MYYTPNPSFLMKMKAELWKNISMKSKNKLEIKFLLKIITNGLYNDSSELFLIYLNFIIYLKSYLHLIII